MPSPHKGLAHEVHGSILAALGATVGSFRGAHGCFRQVGSRADQLRLCHAHSNLCGARHPERHRLGHWTMARTVVGSRTDLLISGPVGARHGRIVALLFSRAQGRRGSTCCAHRQTERRAGRSVRGGFSWREPVHRKMDRRRSDRGRSRSRRPTAVNGVREIRRQGMPEAPVAV